MINFLNDINCILLHWQKKTTLGSLEKTIVGFYATPVHQKIMWFLVNLQQLLFYLTLFTLSDQIRVLPKGSFSVLNLDRLRYFGLYVVPANGSAMFCISY